MRCKQQLQQQSKRIKQLTKQLKSSQRTLDSHNISSYTLRRTQSKKSTPQLTIKLNNCQDYISDCFQLLNQYYVNNDIQYFKKMKKYLNSQWETHKKIFVQHLNKILYLEHSMETKNYTEIQLEIIIEWRKNPILYHVRSHWYSHLLDKQYHTIDQFMKQYNLFKGFVGELAFFFFKGFFKNHSSWKDLRLVLQRLIQKTSHLIIAHTTTWSKICIKHILPLLQQKISQNNINNIKFDKFTMQQLQIKTIAVDYQAVQNQMPKTTDKIQKFIIENKTLEKIKLLRQIRQSMEKQIQLRQTDLIKRGILREIKVLDKDDFVDCLVYCVVKGNISLQKLGVSIKYFHYLLGSEVSNILSKFKCDPYLADLEVVYDFLVQHGMKNYSDNLLTKTLLSNQSTAVQ